MDSASNMFKSCDSEQTSGLEKLEHLPESVVPNCRGCDELPTQKQDTIIREAPQNQHIDLRMNFDPLNKLVAFHEPLNYITKIPKDKHLSRH